MRHAIAHAIEHLLQQKPDSPFVPRAELPSGQMTPVPGRVTCSSVLSMQKRARGISQSKLGEVLDKIFGTSKRRILPAAFFRQHPVFAVSVQPSVPREVHIHLSLVESLWNGPLKDTHVILWGLVHGERQYFYPDLVSLDVAGRRDLVKVPGESLPRPIRVIDSLISRTQKKLVRV